jgi:hypothetical protein
MMPTARKLLERVAALPPAEQEELAAFVHELELRRTGDYHATPEELQAIDEALAQIARGEISSAVEVEKAFAAFRA